MSRNREKSPLVPARFPWFTKGNNSRGPNQGATLIATRGQFALVGPRAGDIAGRGDIVCLPRIFALNDFRNFNVKPPAWPAAGFPPPRTMADDRPRPPPQRQSPCMFIASHDGGMVGPGQGSFKHPPSCFDRPREKGCPASIARNATCACPDVFPKGEYTTAGDQVCPVFPKPTFGHDRPSTGSAMDQSIIPEAFTRRLRTEGCREIIFPGPTGRRSITRADLMESVDQNAPRDRTTRSFSCGRPFCPKARILPVKLYGRPAAVVDPNGGRHPRRPLAHPCWRGGWALKWKFG